MTTGLSREGFDIQLGRAQVTEQMVAALLLDPNVEVSDQKEYVRVEVKEDFRSRVTGNVFVEYRQKGRPSGLLTSTADWWCFRLLDDVLVIVASKRLRQLARVASRNTKNRVLGGDYNQYKGVLVRIADLVQPLRIVGR